MAPSLKISAGPSVDQLQTVAVNHDESPTTIDSPHFQGRIAVRIKSFTGSDPDGVEHRKDTPYFENGHGKHQSWSMQIQGRFKEEVSADDLIFGNEFDKPIKDHLPYGTSVALQFVKLLDPNLEHDLYAQKPHAWSPYLATMPRISSQTVEKQADGFDGWPAFPLAPEAYVEDDISSLIPEELAEKNKDTVANFKGIDKAHEYRQRFLGNKENRQQITIKPEQVVTADFFNGFIDFNDLTLHIPFSGGLKFDLKKYWDGQPVRYICKDKKQGRVFFVIQFDIVDLHN